MSKHSSADRLLQIPIALGQAPEALSAKELSLTPEQPLSSTHQHLRTLLCWDLAGGQAGRDRYLPGPACLQLAKKFDHEASLIGPAKPELKRLVDLSQESVVLMVASNQQTIYPEPFDGPQPLCCCYQKGLARPLLHGASTKVLLAHLEDEWREELYPAQEFSAERIDKLEQEFRLIREQGYAVSQGETDEGVWGISVPLLDSRQRLYGALSLVVPALRARSHSERSRQWTLDIVARPSAWLDWSAGVSIHFAPDMSLWQSRIDSQGGAGARHWHQWMRPCAGDAEATSVLLGFASNGGVHRNQGRQGARHGPPALRRALANLTWHGEQATYDAGSIVADDDLEAVQECYAQRVVDLLAHGHRVVGLGGGHEIAYTSLAGLICHLSRHERLPRIGILSFDAHLDLRRAERASSGMPLRQIAELCQASDRPFARCYLGTSRLSNTAALFDQAQRLGVCYLLDRQLQPWNLERSEAFLDSFLQSVDHLYLTVCLDVLPAAQVPGINVFSVHDVEMPVMGYLAHRAKTSGKLRLIDIAELNSQLDSDQRTIRVAARLVNNLVNR